MEENISILMADLTGYTALTETHGATSAADLIDRYLEIVEDCLVGDCELKERTGDEVMIVSQSSDFLLSTALRMIKNTSKEDNFLQVHGGLHYGKVLKRGNSYFGSTINLASRIATKANPGTFWCSEEFIGSISDKSLITLKSLGKHSFKNINAENKIAELVNEPSKSFVIDPVCRMQILDKTIAIKHPHDNHLFFCSSGCLDIFRNNQLAASSI
jgi:class 3 adenylate cyclase/YHS domain-containing protein